MMVVRIALFGGLLALFLVAIGIAGANFGLLAPFAGFQLFILGFAVSVVAFVVSLIGVVVTASPARRADLRRAIGASALNMAIALPVIVVVARTWGYPPINDITTDLVNPPEFVHARELKANRGRDMKYDAAKFAQAQRGAYADLEPLRLQVDPEAAFNLVKVAAAATPRWRITYSDPAAKRIEGVSVSSLFHFRDDFVIEVRNAEDRSALVEMRSKSRDGIGDLGANYLRIRAFLKRLGDRPNLAAARAEDE